jgi:hypothetical protein
MIFERNREMYNELDNYIMEFSGENSSDDYWYDIGFRHTNTLLNKFRDEDWRNMAEHLDEKSATWKKRLIYCLGNGNNDQEIDVIMKMIDTSDEELFVMCIDALRGMITINNKNIIASPEIVEKTLKLIPKTGLASKKGLEIFIQRTT